MVIEKIFQGNVHWVESQLEGDAAYFEKLSAPQKPRALYIGCCDSRVVPEMLMGVMPGEIFVHRNIANIISSKDENVMSVIQYAVENLSVAHIIVCGHYGCGGVQAATQMQSEDQSVLDAWIRPIARLYEKHKETLLKVTSEEERHKKLVRMHLEEQCRNLVDLPIIEKVRAQRSLAIHGLVFDIASGLLEPVVKLP